MHLTETTVKFVVLGNHHTAFRYFVCSSLLSGEFKRNNVQIATVAQNLFSLLINYMHKALITKIRWK